MSHNHLFDTYKFISTQLENSQKALCDDNADESARQFAAGRIEALCEIERYIIKNFEPKLPRRLRSTSAYRKNM